MCTFWQHLYGIQIFLVEVAAEKPSKRGQKWHFGCFSHFLEDFGLPSTPYNSSSHTNELQLGAHTLCAPFGNIRMVCGSFFWMWQLKNPQKRAKNGILAIFHTFWRALAYLAPITSAPATQMSCSRVHTPYVDLLATFAWYAELSCRCGS